MYDALLHPILLAASHGGKRNSGHLLWDWPKSLGNPFFLAIPNFSPHRPPPWTATGLEDAETTFLLGDDG